MAAPQQPTNSKFASLPRSVTWRLRLGLLKTPPQSGSILLLEDVIRHNAELIQQEQSHYERLQNVYGEHLTANHQEEEEEEEETEEDQQLSSPPFQEQDPLGAAVLDPLTAMLQEQQAQEDRRQELDLRYRKERARRKRGLATEAKVVVADCDEPEGAKKLDADTLNIVDKDLNRLPSPDISDFDGVSIQWENDEQRQAWTEPLREILYIFGQEHPHIGYRQGMHEVASYLWMALEIDRKIMLKDASTASTEMQIQMQEQSTLLFGRPAAYSMLRSILSNVRQAFDVKVASNSRPLEDMSHSILAKIKQQHNYHGLQDHLTPLLLSLSVPPQLYCTKWIRLLFSREVVGAQSVIVLWDVFIELVAEGWEWMAVLETTAASRILLRRDQLLDTSMPDYSQAAHHHRAMDLLMNMPPMDNIELLISRLKALLELQKYTQCMHQEVAQQDEANHRNNPLYNGGHQHHVAPQHQQNYSGFPTFGEDISSVFSLKSLRQSLEQSAQQISSSSDTLKKRLVEEWNTLKQPPQDIQQTLSASPSSRSYMMDAGLFGDEEEMQPHQQQPGPVPAGYPQPLGSMTPQHPHHGRQQQQNRPQQRQQQPRQQVPAQRSQSPNFGAPIMTNGRGHNPLMGPNSAATSAVPNVDSNKMVAPGAGNTIQPKTARVSPAPGQLPHELAYRLGNSVSVLQDFVMSVARPNNQNQYANPLALQNGNAGMPAKVPNTVWEALAEVEAVRNVLLQQPTPNRFK